MPWKIWEPPWSNWSNLLLSQWVLCSLGVYILKSAAEDLNSNNLNIVSNYSLKGRLSNCFRLQFPLECLNLWSKLLPSPDTWVKFLQNNFPLTLSLEPARIPTNLCLLRSLVVLQSLSHVRLFATPWTAAGQASLSFTISQSLLKLMSIESVMSCNHLIFCLPTCLLFPQSSSASGSFPRCQLFTSGDQRMESLSFITSPASEYWGLIFLRIDWLDSLAVQGIPNSLLTYRNSKVSILWCSASFMVQLSYPYITMT